VRLANPKHPHDDPMTLGNMRKLGVRVTQAVRHGGINGL
jgi:hypothetical protein